MKSLVCILLFSAVLAMAGLGPDLKIADEVQLDPQVVGTSVKTSVPFTNSGKEVLTISKIDAPCGCTTAVADRTQLQPGETGSIEVTIDTTRLSAAYDKTLRIHSNDQDTPEKSLRIRFDLGTSTASTR